MLRAVWPLLILNVVTVALIVLYWPRPFASPVPRPELHLPGCVPPIYHETRMEWREHLAHPCGPKEAR
jgi:hypothetical protein